MEDVAHPGGARGRRTATGSAPRHERARRRNRAADEPQSEAGANGAIRPSSPLRRFIIDNRASLGTLAVFVVMMAIFIVANPRVFTTWPLYSSVLTTLPVALFLVVPLVFVVTAGEIDLSFPATMGFAAWMFALVVQAGYDPFLGIAAAIVTGIVLGFCVGALVVYAGLSSLIATLGMNFHAARPDPDHHRGQVDRARHAQPDLGLQDLLEPGLRRPGADLLGDRLRRLLRAPLQPPPLRRAGARSSATIPTARSRWASTSSASA